MLITPANIEAKTFRVALKGYAEDEVDDYLDEIVATIVAYEGRLESAEARIADLESEVAESRKTEDAMRRTFALAQRTADEITEEARREAERLVSDARSEASHLTASQGAEKNQLIAELDRLRSIVSDVKGRLADVALDVDARMSPIDDDIARIVESTEPYQPPAAAPAFVAGDAPPEPPTDLHVDASVAPGDADDLTDAAADVVAAVGNGDVDDLDAPSITGVLSGFDADAAADGADELGELTELSELSSSDEEIPLAALSEEDPDWIAAAHDAIDAGGGDRSTTDRIREALEGASGSGDGLFRDHVEVDGVTSDDDDGGRPRRPWER